MLNKIKSEQYMAVISVKKVAIFQASLKLVREEAGVQLSNKDNKYLTSQRSKHLQESRRMML